MAVVSSFKTRRRIDAIIEAVTDVLAKNRAAIDQSDTVRGLTLTVKMRAGTLDVRTVLLTVESEYSQENGGS